MTHTAVHSVVIWKSVLLVLTPLPIPMPRCSPLVPRQYFKEPKPARLNLNKRIFTIYRWIDVFYTRNTGFPGRSRPTKVLHTAAKAIVPVHPAPPTPDRRIVDDTPVYSPPSSVHLAGLWDTYKLVIGWITMTYSVVVLVFIRFLSREQDITHLATLDASLPTLTSIIEIYWSLRFPPVTLPDAPYDSTWPTITVQLLNMRRSREHLGRLVS